MRTAAGGLWIRRFTDKNVYQTFIVYQEVRRTMYDVLMSKDHVQLVR